VHYLLLGLIVFGVNLLPAFGPPTWTLLVYARLRWHLDPVLLVALGVVTAASGRLVLGVTFRAWRTHFSERYRENLEYLRGRLVARRGQAVALASLFVISPLPSAQLFCAAGLLNLRMRWLAVAFGAGRVVTYSLYVTTAVVVDQQFGSVLANVWGEPWWIALQLVLLVALTLLPLFPWGKKRRPA
jgi:hypothetical protein